MLNVNVYSMKEARLSPTRKNFNVKCFARLAHQMIILFSKLNHFSLVYYLKVIFWASTDQSSLIDHHRRYACKRLIKHVCLRVIPTT